MKSILEDLFFGEVQPQINGYGENPRLKKVTQTLAETEEVLLKLLDGKEKRLFIEMINAQGEVDGNRTMGSFICGFKLGARIIGESFFIDA